jgi:hypothetical protein
VTEQKSSAICQRAEPERGASLLKCIITANEAGDFLFFWPLVCMSTGC